MHFQGQNRENWLPGTDGAPSGPHPRIPWARALVRIAKFYIRIWGGEVEEASGCSGALLSVSGNPRVLI